MKNNKRLIIVASLALLLYVVYFIFGPETVEYPLPEMTKEEIYEQLQRATEELGLPNISEEDIYYTDFVANSSIGRYIEKEKFTDEQLNKLSEQLPLYVFEVDAVYYHYELDIESGKLLSASNIIMREDAASFVNTHFGDGFDLFQSVKEEGIFSEWDVKQTYVEKTNFADVIKVVDVYLVNDYIAGFDFYGLARGYPIEEDSIWMGLTSLFILIFLSALVIFVTAHLIVKLAKRQVEAFWAPFFLTVIAGVGWIFISKATGVNISGFALLDSGIMIYLTFATLLIRWRKQDGPLTDKIAILQPSVLHGFLTAIIAICLAQTFFFVASFFDTWSSPVMNHIVTIQLDVWYLPLLTLFIGLSPAISEEAIFRNYMIPMFDRVGILFSVYLTSILWGVLHIGYDMYPWYLYVLEFIIVSGPFFYFVYKKYGFFAAIFMHYFYNAWVTTLFLFTIDVKVALVSVFVMLLPFIVYIIRRKTSNEMTTIAPNVME